MHFLNIQAKVPKHRTNKHKFNIKIQRCTFENEKAGKTKSQAEKLGNVQQSESRFCSAMIQKS